MSTSRLNCGARRGMAAHRTIAGRVLLQTHSLALLWMRRRTPSGGLAKEAQAAAMAMSKGDPEALLRLPAACGRVCTRTVRSQRRSVHRDSPPRRGGRRLATFDEHLALCGTGRRAEDPFQLAMAVSAAQTKAANAAQRAAVARLRHFCCLANGRHSESCKWNAHPVTTPQRGWCWRRYK